MRAIVYTYQAYGRLKRKMFFLIRQQVRLLGTEYTRVYNFVVHIFFSHMINHIDLCLNIDLLYIDRSMFVDEIRSNVFLSETVMEKIFRE